MFFLGKVKIIKSMANLSSSIETLGKYKDGDERLKQTVYYNLSRTF